MRRKKKTEKRCHLCTDGISELVSSTEASSCKTCGATWRAQAVMRAVLKGLGYPDETDFNDVNTDLSRIGLGIGDDWKVARALYQKFMYTNSYLDKFPIVDLLDPPSASIEKFEFITCSDVLEHTPPPRKTPIANIYRMLKPGGFVVITVPIKPDDTYREYYSGLVSWNFSDSALHWSDGDGRNFIDNYPEIHGGEGLTVVFRQWSKQQLEEDLNLLGFSQIHFLPSLGFEHSDKDVALVIARK